MKVIRYNTAGGAALWSSSKGVPGETDIPPCEGCGQARRFEFQVLLISRTKPFYCSRDGEDLVLPCGIDRPVKWRASHGNVAFGTDFCVQKLCGINITAYKYQVPVQGFAMIWFDACGRCSTSWVAFVFRLLLAHASDHTTNSYSVKGKHLVRGLTQRDPWNRQASWESFQCAEARPPPR